MLFEMRFATTTQNLKVFSVKQELAVCVGSPLKLLNLTDSKGAPLCCSDLIHASTDEAGEPEELQLQLTSPRPASYGRINVFLKVLTGDVIPIALSAEDTVEHFKCLVYERNGIPPCQQRLIYAGKEIEEKQLLSSYGIKEGSVIHLVVRQGGAC